jgi:hypothetical protein
MRHHCSHPNPVMIIMFMAEGYHKYCTIARIMISDAAAAAAMLLCYYYHSI